MFSENERSWNGDIVGLELELAISFQVLPLVERHFTPAEQRKLVWSLFRAMPLRLLERVLPRVAAVSTPQEVAAMGRNMQVRKAVIFLRHFTYKKEYFLFMLSFT